MGASIGAGVFSGVSGRIKGAGASGVIAGGYLLRVPPVHPDSLFDQSGESLQIGEERLLMNIHLV